MIFKIFRWTELIQNTTKKILEPNLRPLTCRSTILDDCFTTLHVSKNEQRNRKQNNEKKYMVIKQMEKRFMHKFLYTIPTEPARRVQFL